MVWTIDLLIGLWLLLPRLVRFWLGWWLFIMLVLLRSADLRGLLGFLGLFGFGFGLGFAGLVLGCISVCPWYLGVFWFRALCL